MKRLFTGDYKATPLWNNELTDRERIEYLLGELTLEEKFQCLGTGNPEIERLGIPLFGVGGEGAHGVQARHDQLYDREAETCYTTIFPNPIGMSATWDREIIRQAGDVVGKEARALFQAGKHRSLSLWAPTVDLNRDPRWGRLEECYGEDGYLTGEMAGAYVDGMQGNHGAFLQCAATAKHFYANNMEEGRTYVSSSIDWRNKYEYYLEPYRKLIQEHHLEGVMAAYNEINGVPCMLLEKDLALLKKWGLGHVVCDGGDVGQTVNFHKYFSRHSETIAAGLRAHVDCFTDDIHLVADAAREAFEHGMISEDEIDEALFSYFRVMIRLGFFDKEGENPYKDEPLSVVSCEKHRQIARTVTAESVVLLKNGAAVHGTALLPICVADVSEDREKLAVIGPLCDTWDKGWYSGQPIYGVTPWEGIKGAVSEAQGIEQVSGLFMETGISEYKIKLKCNCGENKQKGFEPVSNCDRGDTALVSGEIFLGILADGITVGVVPEDEAEIFLLEQWEHGKVTLRARSNGKYLRVRDDDTLGEKGIITADSTEAFGWFVREMFHMKDTETLTVWDQTGMVLDRGGKLRKETMCPVEESIPFSWKFLCIKDGIQSAVATAKLADKVVLCIGSHPMITCKEEVDREDIRLADYQQKMLQEVVKVNPNVILAVLSSVPVDIIWAKEHVPAILTMATGSMELGRGLADILFGKSCPAGRLNVTWYESEKDLPPMRDYDVIQGERTYQYFRGKTLYPFGHGLTYSRFQYEELEVADEEYVISGSLAVKNIGECCSDEVVQIYARKVDSALKRPRKVLVYFERLKDMRPGEKRTVSFVISDSQLQYYDVISQKMILEPGAYEVMAGASSEDIRLVKEIVLTGEDRGVRDGAKFIAADCFDTAVNHVLWQGHLSYQAVCTENGKDEVILTYDRIMLNAMSETLVLDFWQEYHCDIVVEINGEEVGKIQTENPFLLAESGAEFLSEREQQEMAAHIGEATGAGSLEAHQNWLTRRREIGFQEIKIPLLREKVPVSELFTLTVRWRGKGKLCMFRFIP